jgi:hypothetical protein
MQIYVHKNNQQLGPFTEAEVKAQLVSGALSLQDHVWWQGQANWIPLGQSPLAATLAPTAPGSAPAVPSPLPGATAAFSGGGSVPVTSKLAIWALVCGCLSLLCGIFASVPAIILGHMGLSEIKKNPALQGRGMALAGMILGYVFTTLIVIYLVSIVVLLSMGNNVKDIFKTINAQLNAAQAAQSTNSADQNATTPDQTTNAPDQTTPAPAPTNTPDQSTNSAPAATNAPDQSTNSPASSAPASTPSTNAPDSTTNAAPMNQ